MTSVTREKSFELSAPAEKLFPLFSPEGEKYWGPGWNYENIMGTKSLSEDYVFLTDNHSHSKSRAIWIVKRYVPEEYFVEYYKVEPEEKVGVVSVLCQAKSNSHTTVKVKYKYTPLSASGEKFTKEFTQEIYDSFILEWQKLLLKYLEEND